MRRFLAALESAGALRRIDAPLRARRGSTELQALMRLLHGPSGPSGPALQLDDVDGLNTRGVPLIFNPFGSRERAAMTLGCDSWSEARERHARLISDRSTWREPVLIDRSDAPCKEVVLHDVDLRRDLPHVWFGREGAAYVTGAVVVTRDPDSGERNVGWYRLASFVDAVSPGDGSVYSEDLARRCLAGFFWWNPPMSGIGRHIAAAVRAGRPLELACAVLCAPSVHVAAATSLPQGADELAFAGAIEGRPIELVRCETVDLDVPAECEWVIEGRMMPGVEQPVGWHSNPVGYYDEAHLLPVFEVSCITRRRDPLWYATVEMVPPFDHMYLGLLPIEGELLQDLRARIPEVQDVVVTPNLAYVVQVACDGARKPYPGFGRHVIHAVWGAGGRWARSAKMVIVVGPDVDPRDWASIEWAIMTRVQPVSDILLDPTGPAMLLDPSPSKNAQGVASLSERFGIDATIKVPERHTSYPPTSNAEAVDVAWLAARLAGKL